MAKAAPDRCTISLRSEEYSDLILGCRALREMVEGQPDEAAINMRLDALEYKLKEGERAAVHRGLAARTEADLS